MSEILLQRPIFDALKRYLSSIDLLSLISVDKRVYRQYTNDVIIQYIRCNKDVRIACMHGKLNVLQYIMRNNIGTKLDLCFNIANKHGHLHILTWLHENNKTEGCTIWTMYDAIKNGHLHIVQWLYENKKEICSDDQMKLNMGYAAASGHLNIVIFLHEMQIVFGKLTMALAAAKGHLHIIQWLYDNKAATTDAIDYAAEAGHLHIVQWLYANCKISGTERTMGVAALRGHLHVVQWLHKNGNLSNTTDGIDYAVSGNRLEIIKWLHQNGHSCTKNAMNDAAARGHLHIVQWLHHNIPQERSPDVFDDAVRYSNKNTFEILFWLRQNGYNPTKKTLRAAAGGYATVGTIIWLHQNAKECYTHSSVKDAIKSCTRNKKHGAAIAQYLSQNNP